MHLRARRGEGGSIELTWIRRTRLGGDSWLGLDVPLGEELEAYEIEIRDGDALKRVLASGEPQATYSAAQQSADFGHADLESLDVTIYQLSRAFGRGSGRSAHLHVE